MLRSPIHSLRDEEISYWTRRSRVQYDISESRKLCIGRLDIQYLLYYFICLKYWSCALWPNRLYNNVTFAAPWPTSPLPIFVSLLDFKKLSNVLTAFPFDFNVFLDSFSSNILESSASENAGNLQLGPASSDIFNSDNLFCWQRACKRSTGNAKFVTRVVIGRA